MSNKYAPPRNTNLQQPQQPIANSVNSTYCEICGEQYEQNDRNLLICSICGNKAHLSCEQLTKDECQILCNPNKHPNILWKCVNCSKSRLLHQPTNLENLVEMMFNELQKLHSKVDYLCKNQQQTISSALHSNHNQGKSLFNQSLNQHNQFNVNQPIYTANQTNNYASGPKWRYLPNQPASSNLNNNHLDNSYYASNLETDEYRNLDMEHLSSSQANNSHFKTPKQHNSHYQPTSSSSSGGKNQSMDLINSNKLLVDNRAQNKSQSCETNTTQYTQDLNMQQTSSNIQPLYSPTQMLNHLTQQQQQPQLETLTELIYDVVIKPPDIPNKEYLLCVLSHIESPSEFYVHVTDESTSNPVDDISEQLMNCYSRAQYPVLTDNLDELKNKFFAALYSNDDNWYRVRVLDVFDNSKLLVQYVDYGNTETVSLDKLNYLKQELAEVPMQSVKCSLSHIKPFDKTWTNEHKYFFQNISGYDQEKIVTAYITNRPEVIDYDSIIEVFLWNNDVQLDGLRMDGSKDILINSLMVEIGIACSYEEDNYEWIDEAIKITKENTDLLTPTDSGIKIVATPDTNRPALPTTLNSNLSKDLEINQNLNITSNTLTPNSAYAGNQSFESECSFDTETLDESRTYTDQILSDNMTLNDINEPSTSILNSNNSSFEKKWNLQFNDGKQKVEKIEEFLTKPLTSFETQRKPYPLDLVPGTTVFIKITSTYSPSQFYAVLPFGSSSYEKINVDTAKQLMDKLKSAPEFIKYKELSNKMKIYYSKTGVKDQFKVLPKIGWLVAAKEVENYFRARVVQANPDNVTFQLQCVDTGKISTVNKNNIFKLKPEFYELAEFAVQYSMPNIEPFNCNLVNNRKATWTDAAKKAFMDFTFGNVFLANILEIVKCGSSSSSGVVNKSEKVLCELLNIFEEQENVDDYLISNKHAQFVRDEDRLRVELSSSLESDKNSLIKDDNNNDQEDKNKEILSKETNGEEVNLVETIERDDFSTEKLADRKDDEQLINAIKNKSLNDDNQEPLNGKLESDSKQTSIETDYSNE